MKYSLYFQKEVIRLENASNAPGNIFHIIGINHETIS